MNHKTVLVTGGAGFIGTNFVFLTLKTRADWTLVNLDALTYAGNPVNFEGLSEDEKSRHQLVHGNIADLSLLERLFDRYRFDGVVHFAAESHVDRSIQGPEIFLETNTLGTFRLLEAARRFWESGVLPEDFRFLHISTDEVYGSLGRKGRFSEDTPYDPSSPYSASKAASDHFARAYYKTYGLPTLITNCSNNYGPYQFPEKLIPLMILNALEKKPLPVYGDGKNIRDWLYVLDHCEALILVFERGIPGETYNIGGNGERENLQVVHRICDLIDQRLKRSRKESSRRLIQFVKDRPGHDRRYAIDSTKIQRTLGWRPRYAFEQALEATVDWYLNNMKWVDMVRTGEYRKWIQENYGGRCGPSSARGKS